MEKEGIQIAALQETKLTDKSTAPTTPNHTFIRCDCKRDKGGGLAFSALQPPHPDGVMETQSMEISAKDSKLIVMNVYIPPQSSFDRSKK